MQAGEMRVRGGFIEPHSQIEKERWKVAKEERMWRLKNKGLYVFLNQKSDVLKCIIHSFIAVIFLTIKQNRVKGLNVKQNGYSRCNSISDFTKDKNICIFFKNKL